MRSTAGSAVIDLERYRGSLGTAGLFTLWANGGTQPVVSTLNALDGSITSNMAVVPTSNGLINAYAAGPGETYLILDISGYFAP